MSESTRTLRAGQWKCYIRFCNQYGLDPYKSSPNQLALYSTHLSTFMKASSIITYIQAVNFQMVMLGLPSVSLKEPLLKMTLQGISRLPVNNLHQRDPMLPSHLSKIYDVLDVKNDVEIIVYVSSLLMFRTLLRVSHVVKSPHTLKIKDVVMESWGMVIKVNSSKTSRTTPQDVPVYKVNDKTLCPVYWLLHLFKRFPRPSSSPLFAVDSHPMPYSEFAINFNKLVRRSGIVGKFSSHSLRRGGATFMAHHGCSLQEIKSRGNWKSNCVFSYIQPTLTHKKKSDYKVASFIA